MNRVELDHRAGHRRIFALLPWYVNGTLAARQWREVHSHLQHCDDCRRETELHGVIRDQVRREGPAPSASLASLDGLMARIEAHEASRRRGWLRWLRNWFRAGALERAVIVQAAAIVLLAGIVAWLATRPEPPAEYRTLGTPAEWHEAGGSYLQLVPQDSLTAAQLQALLLQVNGRVVHGPTLSGVYIVQLDGSEREAEQTPEELAAWLSAQPGVALAAPIGGPERP